MMALFHRGQEALANAAIGRRLANIQTRAHTVSGDVDISSVVGEDMTILA
jgi:hypothetical protein